MTTVSRHLRTEIRYFFNIGSLTSLKEAIESEADADNSEMYNHLRAAALDFNLDMPDKEKLSQSFRHSANGWDRHIRKDIAQFAAWTRKVALSEGQEDTPSLALPYILGRAEAFIEGRAGDRLKTDRLISRMDRAGLAIWSGSAIWNATASSIWANWSA